jgi:hypothetical protein
MPLAERFVTGMKIENRTPHIAPGAAAAGTRRQKKREGHATLSAHEKSVLSWSRERRLEEFVKVNEGTEKQVLESKLLYIDSMALDNGEILDALEQTLSLPGRRSGTCFLVDQLMAISPHFTVWTTSATLNTSGKCH